MLDSGVGVANNERDAMPVYEVRLYAEGEARVIVEAANEDEAEDVARDQVVGFIVPGGEVRWELESAIETEDVPL